MPVTAHLTLKDFLAKFVHPSKFNNNDNILKSVDQEDPSSDGEEQEAPFGQAANKWSSNSINNLQDDDDDINMTKKMDYQDNKFRHKTF
jgi:hypothetical protein